ncbi:hypothetical protein EDD15DRAFT_2267085 [Pisolithus albus]|nr:hypothetical protein EDD15DRAFT_2267085 [Pisolithus albus]
MLSFLALISISLLNHPVRTDFMDEFATFTYCDTPNVSEDASKTLHSDVPQCPPLHEEIPPVDSDNLVGYYSSFCTIA